jgi:hypothetical protein
MTDDMRVPIWLRHKSAFLGKNRAIRAGPGGSDKQADPWPMLQGMMRKRQTVHCSGHLDVGEQYVDAAGVALQNSQGGFGVLGFHYLETFVKQRLNNNQPDQLFILGNENKRLIRHDCDTPLPLYAINRPGGARFP